MNGAPFDAATGQPHAEAEGIMIAAIDAALGGGGSTEFAPPDNQGLIQQSALLQVRHQLSNRLIDVFAQTFVALVVIAVRIPGLTDFRNTPARNAHRVRLSGGPAGRPWKTRSYHTLLCSFSGSREISKASVAANCMR